MKTCIFSSVKSPLRTSHILFFLSGLLIQIVGFDDNKELELAQKHTPNGAIKVFAIETKEKST